MPAELAGPWRAFLDDLDENLTEPVALHCLGGFVVTVVYGLPRPTGDIDVMSVVPGASLAPLVTVAGERSSLHRTHGVYVDVVAVTTCPDGYEARLSELFPGCWRHLRLFALDPYDLTLAKLQRNLQRDRDDVLHVARVANLDLEVLRTRYADELRPYLGRPEREDLTLDLWIAMIRELRG